MGQSRGLPRREKRLERGDYTALGWSVAVFAALTHRPEMSADKTVARRSWLAESLPGRIKTPTAGPGEIGVGGTVA